MSWERRSRGGHYYTRTRRENGRRVREYIGTGPLAEAIACIDEAERAERADRAREGQHRRELMRSMDDMVQGVDSAVWELMRDGLESLGFRQHHGGEWRRRRPEQAPRAQDGRHGEATPQGQEG
ncbi:MAG TPA: hypothetical protein PLD23_19815 [Armatimonadota bacterium]|nr:hypothetical protein [Armatimonadota bacterium]